MSPKMLAQPTTELMISTRLRSNASASIPPHSPAMIIGTRAMPPTSDTAKVDRVMSYTWSPTATMVSCPPMPAMAVPIQSLANAGERRRGVMSARRRRRGGGAGSPSEAS
jgi:hypothetical protein